MFRVNDRIRRIAEARLLGAETASIVEQEVIAAEIRPDVLAEDVIALSKAHADVAILRPFEAAELLSRTLDKHLPPKLKGRYDPMFVAQRVLNELWQLRQTIDELGIPYEMYVDSAVTYLGRPNGRAPRLSQLKHRSVIAHVVREWVGSR